MPMGRPGVHLVGGGVAESNGKDLAFVSQSRHFGELVLEGHNLVGLGEEPGGEVHSP